MVTVRTVGTVKYSGHMCVHGGMRGVRAWGVSMRRGGLPSLPTADLPPWFILLNLLLGLRFLRGVWLRLTRERLGGWGDRPVGMVQSVCEVL